MDLVGVDTALLSFESDLTSSMEIRARNTCAPSVEDELLAHHLLDGCDEAALDGLELPSIDALTSVSDSELSLGGGGAVASAPRLASWRSPAGRHTSTALQTYSGAAASESTTASSWRSLGGSTHQEPEALQPYGAPAVGRNALIRRLLLARVAATRRSSADTGQQQQQQVTGATEPPVLMLLPWPVAQHVIASAHNTGAEVVPPEQAAAMLAAAGSGRAAALAGAGSGSLPAVAGAAAARTGLTATTPQLQHSSCKAAVAASTSVKRTIACNDLRQQMRRRVQVRLALLQQACTFDWPGCSAP